MKKISAFIFLLFIFAPSVFAADEAALYGKDIKDGVYQIEVESSSSMFRVVGCELTVKEGEMTALMTLSGTGYEKLFMGTGEEAASARDGEYIYFEEDSQGKYTYSVPVEALNTDISCAAFSIRRQKWYDRTLVFKADTLPEGAVGASKPVPLPLTVTAVLVIAASAFVLIMERRRSRNEN